MYTLVRNISKGGMGEVWVAQSSEGRRVVVKAPHGKGRINAERLLYESSVLSCIDDKLRDPRSDAKTQLIRHHVIRYIDRLSDSTNPLLVLDFVDGQTLNDAFEGRSVPINIAMQYSITLLNVVGALHSKGIIHRDISPNNIILNSSGEIVLIDFGSCQAARTITGSEPPRYGRVIFKRGFSSPELLQGRSDERSDIFSIGATLFYLLTGKSPNGDMSKSQGLIKPVNTVDDEISNAVLGIIEIAMSPDPNRRFQSAAAMCDAIEASRARRESTGLHLNCSGAVYNLPYGRTDIGRDHICDGRCNSIGINRVRIDDPQKFIEKHHAQICIDGNRVCSIEDLNSLNHTAIGSRVTQLKMLRPYEKVIVHDGDIVALAYNPVRGAYVTLELKYHRATER